MPSFDPTRAPGGRLTRLGIVLDASLPAAQLIALARMGERAGIDAIWLRDPGDDGIGPGMGDVLAAGRSVGAGLERARLGVFLRPGDRSAAELAAASIELAAGIARPLEIAVEGAIDATIELARVLAEIVAIGPPGRPRISAAAPTTDDVPPLLAAVDDIVLPGWDHVDLETAVDETRAAAVDFGRDPDSLGVAALVPVSIGRTGAEASARADGDALFSRLGHPAEIGIFGTLEQCQDRVIALAHAGVSDMRCLLPSAPDVHDVIAQLTAMTIGTTDVLRPGALRSPAPPPPEGWGGRSTRPPRPMVSDDSRRR